MAKYRLTENRLRGMIREAIKLALFENEENKSVAILRAAGVKEISADALENPTLLLNDRGKGVVESGEAVFNWVIELGPINFCSRHNFNDPYLCQRNCDKYLKKIDLDDTTSVTVEGIWLDDEEGEGILVDTVMCLDIFEDGYVNWRD